MILDGLSPGGHLTKLWPAEPLHGTFWRPDLSFDGKRVLFSFKPANEKNFHLYEINVDGRGFVRLPTGSTMTWILSIFRTEKTSFLRAHAGTTMSGACPPQIHLPSLAAGLMGKTCTLSHATMSPIICRHFLMMVALSTHAGNTRTNRFGGHSRYGL